jgi:hypothetical protein
MLIIDHIRNHNSDTPWVPWTTDPESLNDLEKELLEYALDPTFEDYGNFINLEPRSYKDNSLIYPIGCVQFSGNFVELSSNFRFATDEPELISKWTKLIRDNQKRDDYQEAKACRLEIKAKKAKIGSDFDNNIINCETYRQRLNALPMY